VLTDLVGNAMRSTLKLLGGAEQEVAAHTPVEEPLHEAVAALHHAAESMDRHVEVLEQVAATLPAMTEALVKLTEQLGEFLHLAAPLEAAEREISGLGRLFRRRRPHAALPAVAADERESGHP
jgi:DNA repair ATPase RecN